jgi:DNA-binding NarL/FixJ family response regulator
MSGQRAKKSARRIRVHVVHQSRMMAEALSVTMKSTLPGTSIDGWTKSWYTYQNKAQGVADVVVLDNELEDGGPTAAKVRTLARSGAGIVVMGATTYPPVIRRVLDAGAHSYVFTDEPAETVAAALAAASRGERFASDALRGVLEAASDEPVPDLTSRELEVVSTYLSGSGASVPETAVQFGLSAETIRTHIAHARRKYSTTESDILTKMELRRRMIRDGWILQ